MLEAVEDGVEAVESPGRSKAENVRLLDGASTLPKCAGPLAGERWDVGGIDGIHEGGHSVGTVERLQGGLRGGIGIGIAAEKDDAGKTELGGSGIGEEEAVLVVGGEDAMLLVRGFAEELEALVPQLEPAGDGDYTQVGGSGFEQADVVGDDGVAAALEAGGEGGFTGTGVAEEGSNLAGVLDGAGVEREQAVLVAEDTED